MSAIKSKLTGQCQTSVPAEVRRRLGIGPGSVVEWEVEGDHVVVRRAGRFSSEDIHRRLFPDGPPPVKTVEEMDEGIAASMRKKHARR